MLLSVDSLIKTWTGMEGEFVPNGVMGILQRSSLVFGSVSNTALGQQAVLPVDLLLSCRDS